MQKPAASGLRINIRQLERNDLEMRGELAAEDLDLETADEMIHVTEPLRYDLEAQRVEQAILVRGSLRLKLDCECVRCLKPFKYRLELNDWAALLPLEGEEKVAVSDDCVDLTPIIREDMLLEFPQHPLCKADCGGLSKRAAGKASKIGGTGQAGEVSSAWAELNKLKL